MWRRHGNRLAKRDDPRADACFVHVNRIFERILSLLSEPDAELDHNGLTPIMAEELRKAGLL